MQEEKAIEFYQRVTQGVQEHKTITLEHSSGASLPEVKMHPVSKKVLTSVISRLPDAMFEVAEEAENIEEAEEAIENSEGMSMNDIDDDTIEAFEDLVKASLSHDELAPPQMDDLVESLNFETLLGLGTEVLSFSMENDGDVRDFHVQE